MPSYSPTETVLLQLLRVSMHLLLILESFPWISLCFCFLRRLCFDQSSIKLDALEDQVFIPLEWLYEEFLTWFSRTPSNTLFYECIQFVQWCMYITQSVNMITFIKSIQQIISGWNMKVKNKTEQKTQKTSLSYFFIVSKHSIRFFWINYI